MKHCEKAEKKQCKFAAINSCGICGYKENMEEWELCPIILNNWENIIDKGVQALHESGFYSR